MPEALTRAVMPLTSALSGPGTAPSAPQARQFLGACGAPPRPFTARSNALLGGCSFDALELPNCLEYFKCSSS